MAYERRASAGVGGAETARRAGRLLEIVAMAAEPVALDWIAEQAGLTKSTAYRLLRALQEEGWLKHAGRSGYQPGERLTQLAEGIDPQRNLLRHAQPFLASLAARTHETATLTLRNGNWAVVVGGVESDTHALRRVIQIGHSTPLARGCSGLAIMVTLPPGEQAAIARELYAQGYITQMDVDGLASRVSAIQRDGFVISFGENHEGVAAIAAPVVTGQERAISSLVIGGPEQRWTRDAMNDVAPHLLQACAELAATMHRPLNDPAAGSRSST